MHKYDISKVDVKLLRTFVTVFHEGSISRAADRLNLSQPLVSHSLDRLRLAFNDALFVRAGRGIAPTDRAQFLAPEISDLLEKLVRLSEPETLDIANLDLTFCLAANAFERQLVAPTVLAKVLKDAPNTRLRLVDVPNSFVESLRSRDSDLVITPLTPPDHLDILSAPLFEDGAVCFFDPSQLSAEEVKSTFGDLDHAIVHFGTSNDRIANHRLRDIGVANGAKLEVPSFEALPALMRGTRLVATLPTRLKRSLFADFECVAPPFEFTKVKFNMIWHKATHQSPAHQWFRDVVRSFESSRTDC